LEAGSPTSQAGGQLFTSKFVELVLIRTVISRLTASLQLPLLVLASLLILWKVHIPMEEKSSTQTWQEKLKRIDWLGSFVVILAVRSILL